MTGQTVGSCRKLDSLYGNEIEANKQTNRWTYISIPTYIYNSKSLDVVQSLYFGRKVQIKRYKNVPPKIIYLDFYFIFICTFLTMAACCRNIEIVLHPTTLRYTYIYISELICTSIDLFVY